MRFYKCDGSCKINQEDCEFGWWLCDVLVEDENVSPTSTSDLENGNLIFERDDVEESIDLTYPVECNKQLKFEKHEPFVKIHFPVRVHKSQMSPEGYVRRDELNRFSVPEIFCSESEGQLKVDLDFHKVRFKLSKIIPTETLEGKLLLSLTDVCRFKNCCESYEQNILELQGPSVFSKCIHYNNYETPETLLKIPQKIILKKLNYTSFDSLKNSKTENFHNKFLEALELLKENLVKIKEKVEEMQMDLISIRIDFQVEDERTLRLLKESRKLTQELKESNYLNEVLLLLMGRAEKIKSNKWPFRICTNPTNCNNEQLNLIV